jgi:AraC-like DNA-binding protein
LGRITMAGMLRSSNGVPRSRMRVLGSYAIVYLTDAQGNYDDANGVSQNVRTGDLLLLFPDVGHSYGPLPGQTWNEFYIVFDGPIFDVWRQRGLISPAKPVHHVEPVEYWLRQWESIVEGIGEKNGEPITTRLCALQRVLGEMLDYERRHDVEDVDRAWLARARLRLDRLGPTDRPDLEQVARDIGATYATFRKKFTRLAGVPPARYHAKRVMDAACELIQRRGLTNRDVAERCGFCDEFHFSRRFKQVVGLSPKEFRELARSPVARAPT